MSLHRNPTFKKLVKTLLGFPLTIASLYFIFSIINDSRFEVIKLISTINLPTFILGVMCFILFLLLRSLPWHFLLKQKSYSDSAKRDIFYFSFAETKRYIPGNIFSFISRVSHFKEHKIPSSVILSSTFVDLAYLVLTGTIAGILGFIFSLDSWRNIIHLPNSLIIYSVGVLLFITILFLFFTKQKFVSKIISFDKSIFSIKLLILYFLSWFFYGLAFYFIFSSAYFFTPEKILFFASFFVFAWLIGFLSFVAPMGLGVREAVITLGLAPFAPLYILSSLALLTRVVMLATEALFVFVLYLLYKFRKLQNFRLDIYLSMVIASVIGFATYFSFFSISKHNNFFTGRFDLGNMDQTVWNTLNGRVFEFTNPDSAEIISRMAFHSDVLLILLAPFYLLWNDPRVLLVIQAVVVGIGALFVYFLGDFVLSKSDTKLAKPFAFVFSLSYLLNPFVQKQVLFDFHSVALATTFLLGTMYFLVRKKTIPFLIFLLLAVLTKENVFLIAFIIGIISFKYINKWVSLVVSLSSLAIFYILISKIIPDARNNAHFALEFLDTYGDRPGQIISNIFLKPDLTFSLLTSPDRLEYIKMHLVPVGFLSIFSPLFLLPSLPDWALNLLANSWTFRSVNFHYGSAIIPFVYVSSIFGARFLFLLVKKDIYKKVIISVFVFSMLYSTWNLGVLPGSRRPALEVFLNKNPDRVYILNSISKIPEDAKVSSTNNLGSHLSHREYIFVFPQGIEKSDYLAFLLNDSFAEPSLDFQKSEVEKLKKNQNFKVIAQRNDFVLFERIKD